MSVGVATTTGDVAASIGAQELQALHRRQPERVTVLCVARQGMASLHWVQWDLFAALRTLDLSRNALRDGIPLPLCRLPTLTSLNAAHCALVCVPRELGALALASLTLAHNNLAAVPTTIATGPMSESLNWLSLRGNARLHPRVGVDAFSPQRVLRAIESVYGPRERCQHVAAALIGMRRYRRGVGHVPLDVMKLLAKYVWPLRALPHWRQAGDGAVDEESSE